MCTHTHTYTYIYVYETNKVKTFNKQKNNGIRLYEKCFPGYSECIVSVVNDTQKKKRKINYC